MEKEICKGSFFIRELVVSVLANLEWNSAGNLLILLGTGTHDHHVSKNARLSWWYAAPRNGHISLFSRKSLGMLAARFGLTYACSNAGTSHLMARGYTQRTLASLLSRGILLRRMRSALKLWGGDLA